MLFQEELLPQRSYIPLLTIFIVAVIIFILGIIITRWWAIKENWNDNYDPSIRLNLFWLISNLILFIVLIPINYGVFIAAIASLLVNLIIGAFATSKFYEKKYRESINFILFILIILLIIWFILYLITSVIIAVVMIGLQIS